MVKNEENFKSIDSLKMVENVINEAGEALKDKSRLIVDSAIPEVLGAVLGAGIGGGISFAALYALGTVGLSAAGITSGLAAAGAVAGGGMTAGIFALAAPVAILAVSGYALFNYARNKKLKQEKERLYQEALKKQNAILKALKDEKDADKDRIAYLNSLNILLQQAVKDLKSDLGYAA